MISAVLGDITQISADAIVNSANPSLLSGGGVCGAIHRAAGGDLELECRAIGKCSVGSAVTTMAFDLPAIAVIHAVGPRYLDGTRGEADLLRSTYTAIAGILNECKFQSVTIPSISTGIYRFPLDQACEIAVLTLKQKISISCNVCFVCFDNKTLASYKSSISRIKTDKSR